MPIAVLVDRLTLDVLHHEVGQAVVRRAPVEQAGDVGVLEPREDLALAGGIVQARHPCPCRA